MNPLPTDPKARKGLPIWKGVMKYFPRTMAAMAAVSVAGNEQHNPGEPLHWSRGKSNDHLDCVARHMIGAGTLDDDGQPHSAKLAWRACANCEIELDKIALEQEIKDKLEVFFPEPTKSQLLTATEIAIADHKVLQSLAAKDGIEITAPQLEGKRRDSIVLTEKILNDLVGTEQNEMAKRRVDVEDCGDMGPVFYAGIPVQMVPNLGSFDPQDINVEVIHVETGNPAAYLGGGMTGFDLLNFPMFDEHKGYLEALGYDVISPADLDRQAGIDEYDYRLGDEANWPKPDMKAILRRDIEAILSLRPGKDAIALMPGWEKSTGAAAEFFFARWWGLDVIDTHGIAMDAGDVNFTDICTNMMKYLRAGAA